MNETFVLHDDKIFYSFKNCTFCIKFNVSPSCKTAYYHLNIQPLDTISANKLAMKIDLKANKASPQEQTVLVLSKAFGR